MMDSAILVQKYCIYIFLEYSTRKIIHFQVEQLHVAGKRNSGMLLLDFYITSKCTHNMYRLTDSKVYNGGVSYNRTTIWHMAHGKISWNQSPAKWKIVRKWHYGFHLEKHLWGLGSTCKERYNVLMEKRNLWCFMSAMYTHGMILINITSVIPMGLLRHQKAVWHGSGWTQELMKNSSTLCWQKNLLHDLPFLSNFCHASELEMYHSTVFKYLSKHHHIFITWMVTTLVNSRPL